MGVIYSPNHSLLHSLKCLFTASVTFKHVHLYIQYIVIMTAGYFFFVCFLGSESCTRGQGTEKQVAIKKSRPRSAKLKLPFSRSKPHDVLKWHVKRSPLNKAIYDHKEQKRITCKKKLELDAECGGANPRLVFHLIPYGLEDDAGKCATLEIEVEISRKTRSTMHSATKIRLSVFVQEMKEDGNFLLDMTILNNL